MRVHMRSVIAVAALGFVATIGGATPASAVQAPEPALRTDSTSLPAVKGVVSNYYLGKGAVFGDNLGPGMVSWFTTVWNGSVHKAGLDADLQKQIGFGKGSVVVTIAPKTIEKIGGPFATNATKLGTFKIPSAGVWTVGNQYVVDRLNSTDAGYVVPTTDTMPSVVLRGDAHMVSGSDAGTAMGVQISRAGRVELTGTTTATVITDGPSDVDIWGFGYNEDTSAFGSRDYPVAGAVPQFTAGVKVTLVKVG